MSELPTFTIAEMNESNRLAADNFKRAKLAEAEARGTPVGWFIGNAEDGFHQVAKEFEGHEGTTPLYAAQPARTPTVLEMVESLTPEQLANWEDGGNCNAGKDEES